jgi:hypothetical protein
VTVTRLQLHYFGHSISQAAHMCMTRIPLASMQGDRLRLNWCAILRAFRRWQERVYWSGCFPKAQ